MNHFTTFSQYEYVRPDFENAKELIRKSVDKIKNAGTKEAVSKVFKAVNDQQRHLRTMATVAEIRNTIDTTDPFYESEMQCFYENMPLVDLEMQEFQRENGASMFAGCLPLLIQLPILYALYYIFNQPYDYVGVINDVYTNITQSILNIDAATRVDVLTPIVLARENMQVDVSVFDQVMALVKTMSDTEWNSVLSALGTAGNGLAEFVAQKNSIEYFFGLNLVSTAGLSFPGIIIPIVAGLTTYLSSWYMQKRQKAMNNGLTEDDPSAGMMKS